MNCSNRNNTRNFRNKALVGAIVAALALGVAGNATAQSANYTLDSAWSQTLALNNYIHSVDNEQSLTGNVTATLGAGNSIFDIYSGSGVLNPQTLSSNTLSALAVGNNATGAGNASDPNDNAGNSIAMGLLAGNAINSGLGILSGQVNDGNKVSTSITDATVAANLTGYNAGAVTANSNTIRADTAMNDASSTISGHLPTATFAGNTDGSTQSQAGNLASPNIGTLDNPGDISIGNAQVNHDTAGSGAKVSGVGITITDTGSANSTATFSNSDNAIAGSFVGNRSDNSVNATGADGAPSYNGSVVVSNGQANFDAPAATTVSNSVITTSVDGSLRGSITQSGDSLSASTQGNTASNAIAFAQGISVDGNAASTTMDLGFVANGTSADAEGDLVLLNAQGNQAGSNFSSAISGVSGIVAQADAVSVPDASVTLHDDHAVATAGGNNATNSISADGSAFAGYVAAGNQQANNAAAIKASVTDVAVGAYMDNTTLSQGSISVDASSIGAAAQGNQASTDVTLAGTQFNAGSGTASGGFDGSGGTSIDTGADNAGVNVANLQGNFGTGTTVSASNSGSLLGAYYSGGISAGSSTVSDNAVGASASGNAATTNVALSGDNGEFSAALVNSQYNENAIKGTVSDAILGIYVDSGAVSNATLTASGNSFGASAYGNQGSNSLSSDFTNLTLGDSFGGFAPSNISDPSVPGNTANAGMLLASSQLTNGNAVGASVGNSQMGVDVAGGNTTNTPVTVNANSSAATAMANQVSNTLSPGVGNLSTGSGDAAPIAALSNMQVANDNAVSASNTLAGSTGLLQTGAQFSGNLSGSAVTVSDNDTSAVAAGNVAGNTLAFSGANYAPNALAGLALNGINLAVPPGSGLGLSAVNSAAFALQNVQASDGGSRKATASSSGSMGILSLGAGSITNSPLTVSGNSVSAAARDNSAGNSLSLDGFSTLTTTAALQSDQISSASLSSSVVGGIGVIATGNVGGSALTDSGNSLAASSVANVANNTLAISAGQLGGDGLDHQIGDLLSGGSTPGTLSGALTVAFPGGGAAAGTLADYGLSNSQTRVDGGGTVKASVSTHGITMSVLGGTLNGGSATVSDNQTSALAQDNSASNSLSMAVTSAATTAALSNQQYVGDGNDASATVTAPGGLGDPTSFAIQVGGAIGNSAALPLTVSGNTMVAQAGLNDAVNALNVTGDSAIDASNNLITGAGAIDLLPNTPILANGAIADYAVSSNQVSGSSATATVTPGLTGIEDGASIGRNGQASSLTVNDNQFAAQASANTAANSVRLDGASSIGASTALSNYQLSGGNAVTAKLSGAQVGVYTKSVGAVSNANLTVSANRLGASASGNSANNAITVQPVALNAGTPSQLTGGATLSAAGVLNGLGTVAAATANNTLANQQENLTAINATVSGSSIGVNPGVPGTASQLQTSTATVGGNSAAASGSGNSASNSIMLASLASGVASSALTSNQVNSANVSATVSAVNIGVTAGAGSSSPVTVSNNTISATAVGNSAVNHIGISN